jgi:nucleotide-binding universal stress UspA family protein
VNPQIAEPARDELLAEAQASAARIRDRYAGAAAALEIELIEDSASAGIQRRLEAEPFDLAVVGGHGRRGWRRWLPGSTAESTVRYSPCSVVVVPSPEVEGE